MVTTRLSVSILLCLICASHAFDQATEYSMRAKIREMITKDAALFGRQPNDYRMVGGLVRLAFHDCVGVRCDGCINLQHSENRGLDVYINKTEELYSTQNIDGKPILSRADFWALAGLEAIQFASELATCPRCPRVYPNIKFQTGRKDCIGDPKGSPWTNDFHEFPDPLATTEDTTEYFKKQFGFNYMETVAILGAHTLGQAHPAASGFAHPWVERKNGFSNQYYQALIDTTKGWKNIRLGRRFPKWQWESEKNGRRTMMLNADISMLKNLTSVSQVGEVKGCTYDTCQAVDPAVANTAVWVKKFAKDNSLFLEKFGKAFQKMISHGYTNLKDVDAWIGFG